MYSVKWIEISGTRYSHGSVVVTGTDLVPNFGIIEEIMVDELMFFYFVLEELQTLCFSSHYHSFEVTYHTPEMYLICKPSDLLGHAVLSLYQLHCSCFVCLQYYLV